LYQEYIKERPYKLENSLSGQAILQGKPLQWEDVSQEPKFQYRTLAERLGLKSLLSIPMIIESRPIGVINFYTTRPRKFSEKEIKFLEAIANHASLAIEKTELSHQTKRMKQALEDRKVIERAKGILMEKKKLTEKEAHELLRKTSMNTRKTMEEIAKAILLAEKI
jgi:GAF domain-containing protein